MTCIGNQVTISRGAGVPISLEEWTSYLTASKSLRPAAPREGVNPFTRQPTLFRPAPGAAVLPTPAGDFAIEYRDGVLIATGPVDDGMHVVNEIARELKASVTRI